MEGIRKVVVALCLMVGLTGCTCTLAACGSDVAEAKQQSQFVVEEYGFAVDERGYKPLFVTTMTDTETGQKWVVVTAHEGVAIAPIEERE